MARSQVSLDDVLLDLLGNLITHLGARNRLHASSHMVGDTNTKRLGYLTNRTRSSLGIRRCDVAFSCGELGVISAFELGAIQREVSSTRRQASRGDSLKLRFCLHSGRNRKRRNRRVSSEKKPKGRNRRVSSKGKKPKGVFGFHFGAISRLVRSLWREE